jgi:hypothetical protein
MEITIPWTPVKALAHLASDGDIRKYLMGVWLDFAGPTVAVVGTCGSALGAYRTEEPSINAAPFFIPKYVVLASKTFAVSVTFRRDDTGHCCAECMGTKHYWQDEGFAMMDWRYPISASCTGVAQQFDARLLTNFLKARKTFGKKEHPNAVQISHNGGPPSRTSGALIKLRDVPDFIGVLMPVQYDDQGSVWTTTSPDWVRDRAEEACDLV